MSIMKHGQFATSFFTGIYAILPLMFATYKFDSKFTLNTWLTFGCHLIVGVLIFIMNGYNLSEINKVYSGLAIVAYHLGYVFYFESNKPVYIYTGFVASLIFFALMGIENDDTSYYYIGPIITIATLITFVLITSKNLIE